MIKERYGRKSERMDPAQLKLPGGPGAVTAGWRAPQQRSFPGPHDLESDCPEASSYLELHRSRSRPGGRDKEPDWSAFTGTCTGFGTGILLLVLWRGRPSLRDLQRSGGRQVAEITARRRGELTRGIFRILLDHLDGVHVRTIFERLPDIVPPTEFELTTYPNRPNDRRYEKIARFATVGPSKAGWLIKEKGTWSLTDEGKAAFHRFPDPEMFARESDRLYGDWKRDQPAAEAEQPRDDPSDPAMALEEAEEAAWTEIQDHLSSMNPYDFQNLVAGLLRGMGYHVQWISPPGPDKGLDIVAHTDPLGIVGPRIKVQVKRRADKIAADGVRSHLALLGDGDVGLFVCTGGFTRDAEEEARRQERRRVMLVDLDRLFDLWVDHYDKIPEEFRRLMPLRPVHFLVPED